MRLLVLPGMRLLKPDELGEAKPGAHGVAAAAPIVPAVATEKPSETAPRIEPVKAPDTTANADSDFIPPPVLPPETEEPPLADPLPPAKPIAPVKRASITVASPEAPARVIGVKAVPGRRPADEPAPPLPLSYTMQMPVPIVATAKPTDAAKRAIEVLGVAAPPPALRRALESLNAADVQSSPSLRAMLIDAAQQLRPIDERIACLRALARCRVADADWRGVLQRLKHDPLPSLRAEAVAALERLPISP